MMRRCTGCQQEKPADQFWRQSSRRDGLQAKCVECMTLAHRGWREALGDDERTAMTARNVEAVNRGRDRDPLGLLLRSLRSRAKNAGLECTITRDDIVIPDVCPVLGIPLVFGRGRGPGLAEKDQRPSIDRIDNARGYTPDNVVVVSYRANRLKSDATIQELAALAAFYTRIGDAKPFRPEPGVGDQPAEADSGEADVPRMFGHAEAGKPEGSVPFGDADLGWDRGSLSSLRLGCGGAL